MEQKISHKNFIFFGSIYKIYHEPILYAEFTSFFDSKENFYVRNRRLKGRPIDKFHIVRRIELVLLRCNEFIRSKTIYKWVDLHKWKKLIFQAAMMKISVGISTSIDFDRLMSNIRINYHRYTKEKYGC